MPPSAWFSGAGVDACTGRGADGAAGAAAVADEISASWLAAGGGGGGIVITVAFPALGMEEGAAGDPFDPPPGTAAGGL